MARIIYLTPNEESALRLYARGKASILDLQQNCLIPAAGLQSLRNDLKRKTGIEDLHDKDEVREYIVKHETTLRLHALGPQQIDFAQKYVESRNVAHLAHMLSIYPDEVPEPLEQLLKLIGIFSKDEATRKLHTRVYLIYYHPKIEPISITHTQLLRAYACGATFEEIGLSTKTPLKYVKLAIRKECSRFGLTARGRDVQRWLVAAYLDRVFDLQEPPRPGTEAAEQPFFMNITRREPRLVSSEETIITMDDPAF